MLDELASNNNLDLLGRNTVEVQSDCISTQDFAVGAGLQAIDGNLVGDVYSNDIPSHLQNASMQPVAGPALFQSGFIVATDIQYNFVGASGRDITKPIDRPPDFHLLKRLVSQILLGHRPSLFSELMPLHMRRRTDQR